MAFGAPPLRSAIANPSPQVIKETSKTLLSRFLAFGERVFSVRVGEVKLHSLFQKDPRMGDALEFPLQQGVFGDGKVTLVTVRIAGADDTEGNVVKLEDIDVDECASKVLFAAFQDTD